MHQSPDRAPGITATTLTTPLAARVEVFNGLYIGVGAGANWLNDTRLRPMDVGGTVPHEAITTEGLRETRPLVQTANGVREPQNRRVEIVLR